MAEKKGVSGTKEWSNSSANCMDGCSNDCLYCYAKNNAVRFGRTDPDLWCEEEVKEDMVSKKFGRRKGVVMFPTTHDITQKNVRYCEQVIMNLLYADNKLLIVSKPDPVVIERLCNRMLGWDHVSRSRVLFRFTIGAMDNDTLRFWEPNAPTYEERLYALMWAYKNGWETSVSMEPLLETSIIRIANQVHAMTPYITDAVWIGKMNNPRGRIKMNYGGVGLPEQVREAMEHIIWSQRDDSMHELYSLLRRHKKVKWKESLKKVFGLAVSTEAGEDR